MLEPSKKSAPLITILALLIAMSALQNTWFAIKSGAGVDFYNYWAISAALRGGDIGIFILTRKSGELAKTSIRRQ